MARSRSGGGIKGGIGNILWFFVIASIIVAFFKVPANRDTSGLWDTLVAKSESVEAWVTSLTGNVGSITVPNITGPGESLSLPSPSGGSSGSAGNSPSTSNSSLESLAVADVQKVNYNRDEWRHWDNVTSCWTVREEVLLRDAQPGSASLQDKNKQPTSDPSKACYITGATWVDPYTGKTFTNPEDLDIDHMVPLGAAAARGGQAWNGDKKRDYANSLQSGHLLAVSASANRSKSDRGPGEWKPDNKKHWCTYAQNWISVSTNWQLTVTPADKKGLQEMLATC